MTGHSGSAIDVIQEEKSSTMGEKLGEDHPGERVTCDYMWRGRVRITYSYDDRRACYVIRGNGTHLGEGVSLIDALLDAGSNLNALAGEVLTHAAEAKGR